MWTLRSCLVAGILLAPLSAQNLAPVINPRGVINAYSQTPAPSQVAPGGIIWINGLNLGPVAGFTADGSTWPTDANGVQVLINNRPSPIYSVEPSRIVAQVPYETGNGTVNVVVRRNGTNSRPARINVVATLPVVKTLENKGYGALDAKVAGKEVSFTVSGLGITEPRLDSGAAATPGDAVRSRVPTNVHVGGLRVEADVRASDKRPGDFDVTLTLPDGVSAGDIVAVDSQNRLANFAAYQPLTRSETTFVAMPAGAPEVRAITASDLRAGFFLASAARTDEGCWPSVLFDLRVRKAARIEQCLSAANRNALTPVVATQNGANLAALVGPPMSDQAVGAKVALFAPSTEAATSVDLPAPAVGLAGAASNNFTAVLGGTPPQVAIIDSDAGTVQMGAPGAGGPGGAGGGAGGGGGAANPLNPQTLRVDLGGGLNKVLSAPVNIAQGQFAVVVGDDENDPKTVKVAVLNQQAEVTAQRDFAAGWLPVVSPNAPQQPAGGGQGGPGGPGPGGPGVIVGPGGLPVQAVRFRLVTYNDPQTRTYYVLSRKTDDSAHAFMAFGPNDVKALTLPDKTFVAACTPNVPVVNIETARRIVLLGSNSPARTFQQVCGAFSFVVLNLDGQEVTNIELPGSGQINATNRADDLNDFLLAANTTGDTMFVLDGVTLTSYRLSLPQGLVGFAGLQTLPAIEMAIATGRVRQQNGDGGFLVFDIANLEVRQLLLPDGIATVQLVGVLPATRKLVARGTRTGNTGSQFLIYDLLTSDVEIVDNPPGVAFVGNVVVAQQPGQGGQGGQGGQPQQQAPAMQRVNPKANTIEAVTFSADRRPNGAMLVRVR